MGGLIWVRAWVDGWGCGVQVDMNSRVTFTAHGVDQPSSTGMEDVVKRLSWMY